MEVPFPYVYVSVCRPRSFNSLANKATTTEFDKCRLYLLVKSSCYLGRQWNINVLQNLQSIQLTIRHNQRTDDQITVNRLHRHEHMRYIIFWFLVQMVSLVGKNARGKNRVSLIQARQPHPKSRQSQSRTEGISVRDWEGAMSVVPHNQQSSTINSEWNSV